MSAIENCRTSTLGGHVYECEDCGEKFTQYNSCRNRHCPQCQGDKINKWVEERKNELLPVSYYHVIFTIPAELEQIVQRNKKLMYDIIFKASAETLVELTADRKYLGAQTGFMSVLHTFGQNLMEHTHIHSLVPAGGISFDNGYWVDPKYNKYLIPVQVLSKVFRRIFMRYFNKSYEANQIKFVGKIEEYTKNSNFGSLINKIQRKGWVVHVCPPFSTGEIVLEYLSRYISKVAITDYRIVSYRDGKVTFKWKDNKDGKNKLMTVTAIEFIRRFLLHILPDRFVKVRYYGFLSNSIRKKKIERVRELLYYKIKDHKQSDSNSSVNKNDLSEEKNDDDGVEKELEIKKECPYCKGILIHIRVLPQSRHGPKVKRIA